MTNLQNLSAFSETAKHNSFARAARQLGVSPSPVAKSVARLEHELGVRLFQRTTRSVSLTEDGRALHRRCQRIMEEVVALHSEADGARSDPCGTLRLAVPIVYGRLIVLPLLAKLAQEHTGIGLDVRFSDRRADLIEDGLDAAVRVGMLDDCALVARRFDLQELVCVASPAYLARRGMPVRPSDVLKHDCIVSRWHATGRERVWAFRRGRKQLELLPNCRYMVDEGEAGVAAALAGLGLVQLPDYMVEQALRDGRLREVLGSHRPAPLPISIVYPSHRHVSARLRMLIEALSGLSRIRIDCGSFTHATLADHGKRTNGLLGSASGGTYAGAAAPATPSEITSR